MSSTSVCLEVFGDSSDPCWQGCGGHSRNLNSEAFPYPFFVLKAACLSIVEIVSSAKDRSFRRLDGQCSKIFCDGRVEVVFVGGDDKSSVEILKSTLLFTRGMSLSSVVYNMFAQWHECNKRFSSNGELVQGLSPSSYVSLQNLSLPVVRTCSVRDWVEVIECV